MKASMLNRYPADETARTRGAGFGYRVILLVLLTAYVALFATVLLDRDGNFFPDSQRPIAPDFSAFYTAGRIVADGDGASLYDHHRQEIEQTRALGGVPELFIPFPYPAWMAAPYAALAHLPYLAACLTAMVAMTALLIPALWLLRDVSRSVRDAPFVAGLALAAFWPLYWGVTSGQGTPFWLLCLAGLYAGLRQSQDVRAGIWLALLAGKPQLAIVLVCALVAQRRWKTVGVAAAAGTGLVLLGAALAGPAWPLRFLSFAIGREYNDGEIERAGMLQMSLPGAAAHVFGAHSPLTTAVTVTLGLTALAVAVAVGRRWVTRDRGFPLQFGLIVAVTLATSPHALFYDAPLLVLPVLFIVDDWRAGEEATRAVVTRRRQLLLAGIFASGFAWQLWPATYVQPLALLPVAIAACVVWRLARGSEIGRVKADREVVARGTIDASSAA
jgi:hypothetical protein